MLVAPSTSGEVLCPLCGDIHILRDCFIPMTLDEFFAHYRLTSYGSRE